MVINNTINRIYNTSEKTATQIEQEFVVRQSEFNIIMEDIRTSTMEYPEQEYLIIGEEGMGKTMLLTKIKYEIERDEQLNTWLIPVAFPEELNGASELYDLWLRVAEYLEELHQFTFFKDLSDKIIASSGVEEVAFGILNQCLKDNGKKIILLIDNFGTFLNELDEKEDHRLREILITNPNLRMIAANPETVRDVHRYDKAFYEHFIEIKLKGLNRKETKDLMLHLGKIYGWEDEIEEVIENEPYRIDVFRDLTGGNIRNIVMLFNVILGAKKQDSLSDLMQILDDITPINTGKILQLKKNQKKIIHYVALQWDAVRTADIATTLRMKSNEVSAQLNYLTENQWIVTKGVGRKKLYQLRDRFFNIWYLMRYGRKRHKDNLKYLMNFYKMRNQPTGRALGMQVNEPQPDYSLVNRALDDLKNGQIEDAIRFAQKFMYNKNFINNNEDKILIYLIRLLNMNQIHIVYNYLADEETGLKERFKPLWYATVYLKEGESDEFLKMGDELKGAVNQLLNEIKK